MAKSDADLAAMKAEMTNDPNGLGLVAPPAIDDVGNEQKLKAVIAGQLILRPWLSTADLLAVIDAAEHQALTPQQARYLDSVLLLQQISPATQPQITAGVRNLFLPLSKSGPAIDAVVQQDGNRIQQMVQQGLIVDGNWTTSDISAARNFE